MISKIKIPDKFINQLVKLPENGMGYHLVKVFLSNGKLLRKHKVLNSSLLIVEQGEIISSLVAARLSSPVKSIIDTFGVGTLTEMPSILPFK